MMRRVTVTEVARNERHVTLQVRGFGEPGSRPLLGTVICAPDEAADLATQLACELNDVRQVCAFVIDHAKPATDIRVVAGRLLAWVGGRL